MIHDRTRYELRKKGDKQRVLGQRTVRHLPPVSVHDKGNLLEGKKTDSQRKENTPQSKTGSEHAVHGIEKEVKIFEVEQHAQIQRNRQNQNCPAGRSPVS